MDFYGQNVNVWIYQDSSLYNEIGVSAADKNVPVFYFRSNGREESFALTVWEVFTAGPPDSSKFDVPHSCLEPKVHNQILAGSKNNMGKNLQQIRSSLFRKVDSLMSLKQVDHH